MWGGGGVGGFFFQAEDGIRDYDVTGVQTCALPILEPAGRAGHSIRIFRPGDPEVANALGLALER
mgnify:CR=1 FL=1